MRYPGAVIEAWYRYVTLAMVAAAWLAVTRADLADGTGTLTTSLGEIRRMFTALCSLSRDEQHAHHLSRWRLYVSSCWYRLCMDWSRRAQLIRMHQPPPAGAA